MPLRIAVLVCVFLAGAWYESGHNTSLLNSDIWLHLRTGAWILQNHTVPHTGLFTRHSDLEWIATTWGFDLLLALCFKLLGLPALPLLLMIFKTALALATFFLAQGWRGKFWPAVALTAAVQYVLLDFPPSPAMISALFLAIEICILLKSGTAAGARPLCWLPILFVCWANLDAQFLNGLLVLGLYVAAALAQCGAGALAREEPAIGGSPRPLKIPNRSFPNGRTAPLRSILLFSALSAAATLLSPYFYRPYLALFQASIGPIGIRVSDSLHSISFRQPQHYVLLLLTMAAFFALGRERFRDLFHAALIPICAAYAFHWQQDMWFVALPAVAVIADALNRDSSASEPMRPHPPRLEASVVAISTILLFALAAARIPSQQILISKISAAFPVKAAGAIRQNRLPGPLYNAYAWGSFLTWYLPDYPVSIDGRIEMYGRPINDLFFETATGLRPLEDDPTFNSSRTFLLKRDTRLADMITHLPGFEMVYSDNLSMVVVRQTDVR